MVPHINPFGKTGVFLAIAVQAEVDQTVQVGSVALVRARVEVTGTAPGMLATQ